MNIARFAIEQRVVTVVLSIVVLLGGAMAFLGMPRLEDPEFTIKDVLVITPYPGAMPAEVENEVTDEIELAVQQMGQLDKIVSRSERGLSTLTVTMKNKYDSRALPQVWDELRRKVGDVQRKLPPGAGPSLVIDDFGDVYGIFVAVYGSEYSYAEIKKVVDLLRRELVLVKDVAKIETFGERTESILIAFNRDRMAQLGVPPVAIVDALKQKNLVSDAGSVQVGSEFIAINPTGTVASLKDFEAILIVGSGGRQFRLRDIASVRRSYVEPPENRIRYDGAAAIGLGISTVSGGNVVSMGQAVEARVRELLPQIPLGIEFGIISLQSDAVVTAISGFTQSLWQAVVIVIVVLLFFMGLRSGLLIGFILALTIAGSFIFLKPWGVALERISLGALIIALGMLVDNAIVVVDGTLVRMQKGLDATRATLETVAQSMWPLLGATLIAVLAFAAIGTSQDSTGEFTRSLYQVVLVSLLFSWVTAITVTPLACVMFLKPPSIKDGGDAFGGKFYGAYRRFLEMAIARRWLTLAVVVGLFFLSLYGFRFVDNSFFPPSTRPQFIVDVWMPRGTHIDDTTRAIAGLEDYLRRQDGVTHVSAVVGKGALRFLLTYSPEKTDSGYAQLFVDVKDIDVIDGLIERLEAEGPKLLPGALLYGSKFQLGPGATGKIQARLSGPDPNELRRLANEVEAIVRANPLSKSIRNDWRERVKVIRPVVAEEQANLNGITRADIANTLLEGFQGARIGVYREGDLVLPIILRAAEAERGDVGSLYNLQIWSPVAERMIPLRQVVSRFETVFTDDVIIRRNRKPTLTVFTDPKEGTPSALFRELRPKIEAVKMPPGYTLEWGGEYEDSGKAMTGLMQGVPAFFTLMILITVVLFNSLRQTAIIWLVVPLALIGVTAGLLGTGQPFGFMALLGFMSLSGMLIKNAIVLIDEINALRAQGIEEYEAIIQSGVSRLRPVAMAAATTALGMIPLLPDAFFSAMAVTIIGGLLFATVLTMVVVPTLYAVFYRAGPSGSALAVLAPLLARIGWPAVSGKRPRRGGR